MEKSEVEIYVCLLIICALYLITLGARSNQRHSAINEIGSNKITQGILLGEALITLLHSFSNF